MKIEKTGNATETVLTVSGCLETAVSGEFSAALEAAAGAKTLVLDFGGLEFIASSGLRLLVVANKRAQAEGRKIVLRGLNDVVAEVFDVTGLKDVFDIR